MIARIWQGITRATDIESDMEYLNCYVIPGYQAAEGYQRLYIMREHHGELTNFLLLTF